jgi:hypothetical protein
MNNIFLLQAVIDFRKNFTIYQDEKLLYFLKRNKKYEGEWVYDAPVQGSETETRPCALYTNWYIKTLCEENYNLEKDCYDWNEDAKVKDVWKVTKAVTVNEEFVMTTARNDFKEVLNEVIKMIVETIKKQEVKLEKELEALKKKRNEAIEKTF